MIVKEKWYTWENPSRRRCLMFQFKLMPTVTELLNCRPIDRQDLRTHLSNFLQ